MTDHTARLVLPDIAEDHIFKMVLTLLGAVADVPADRWTIHEKTSQKLQLSYAIGDEHIIIVDTFQTDEDHSSITRLSIEHEGDDPFSSLDVRHLDLRVPNGTNLPGAIADAVRSIAILTHEDIDTMTYADKCEKSETVLDRLFSHILAAFLSSMPDASSYRRRNLFELTYGVARSEWTGRHTILGGRITKHTFGHSDEIASLAPPLYCLKRIPDVLASHIIQPFEERRMAQPDDAMSVMEAINLIAELRHMHNRFCAPGASKHT